MTKPTSAIKGIKSVDFKIQAKGHGVVNWNGSMALSNDGMTVENHTLPKLRGYTNLTGRVKEETGYKYKKEITDVNFKENPLYISQNCIRHHLFRDQAYDMHFAKENEHLPKVLASITGLLRGYVVPDNQCKRTSPLLIEDFVDQLGNGNFEQFNHAGERNSSSFFSKTTFGDTEYISYGSISIEQLQFISLDNKFDRCAMVIKDNEGQALAKKIEDFIASLAVQSEADGIFDQEAGKASRRPTVTFHPNFVRQGTIFEQGEAGLILDDVAIDILVQHMLVLIKNLVIRQAKGYMYVENVDVDYNTSTNMMRIKHNTDDVEAHRNCDYAVYYQAVDASEDAA
ncbi:type I-Fv CRISPR-associated protein Cas7fv [Moraxella sp. ZJ142]|uniref:type I-Fv CRISPR-associated protein Cas7fv n=1 Tax=Moraxella marmotae TaxID=3344520 RepID=UPI0035D42685